MRQAGSYFIFMGRDWELFALGSFLVSKVRLIVFVREARLIRYAEKFVR